MTHIPPQAAAGTTQEAKGLAENNDFSLLSPPTSPSLLAFLYLRSAFVLVCQPHYVE